VSSSVAPSFYLRVDMGCRVGWPSLRQAVFAAKWPANRTGTYGVEAHTLHSERIGLPPAYGGELRNKPRDKRFVVGLIGALCRFAQLAVTAMPVRFAEIRPMEPQKTFIAVEQ
jgi:hypothetical protein